VEGVRCCKKKRKRKKGRGKKEETNLAGLGVLVQLAQTYPLAELLSIGNLVI
jgi:hypothetical protein